MKTWLLVGGPLILFTGFVLHSDLLTFGTQHPGVVHIGGAEQGGTFMVEHQETYQCDEYGENCVLVDEKTEFSEVAGLEIEEQPIEYREGIGSDYNKTKQPGIPKYTNITMKRPSGFSWSNWKFMFEYQVKVMEAENEFAEQVEEQKAKELGKGVEMVEIDPPVLVIPAQ